jgi:hypothetical protein
MRWPTVLRQIREQYYDDTTMFAPLYIQSCFPLIMQSIFRCTATFMTITMPPLLNFPSLSFAFSDYQDSICRSPKNKKHKVSFFSKALVFDHWNRFDFSEEERESIWYSKKELHDVQLEAYRMALRMNECREDIECSRGLEQKTPAGVHIRHRHRQEALTAVIQAQEDQWRALNDQLDPEQIAKAYTRFTDESTKVATLMAAIDHETVKHDLPTPRGKTLSLAQTVACSRFPESAPVKRRLIAK